MARPPKYTIDELCRFYNEHGCKLLETSYSNSNAKLRFRCACGNECSTKSLHVFLQRPYCNECGRSRITHSYEFVRDFFSEHNCTLLSESYVNSKDLLRYVCSCGNVAEKSFNEFRYAQSCNVCKSNKIKSIDEVRAEFSKHDLQLLSTEYINSKQKLEFVCSNGHKWSMSYNHFLRTHRCGKCQRNAKKTYDEIVQFYESRGCKLLETEYVNGLNPMRYICSCGNEHITSYSYFHDHPRCPKCLLYTKWTLDMVREYFDERDCVLLSTEYKTIDTKLDYICSCGRKSSITLDNFKNGQRCMQCGIDAISGENHYAWSSEMTDEERALARRTPEYKQWRYEVYKKFNYECQACGTAHGKLNAHHIRNFSTFKQGRYDVNNAILFCERCHIDFHVMFGRKNNNQDQVDRFVELKQKEVTESGECMVENVRETAEYAVAN